MMYYNRARRHSTWDAASLGVMCEGYFTMTFFDWLPQTTMYMPRSNSTVAEPDTLPPYTCRASML